MKTKPRIAVVGAGLIGRRHAELVARNAVLDAVIDPGGGASDFAEGLNANWFSDLSHYLDRHSADGIIVATPNRLHAENTLACIERGLPVLVEKPITDKTASAAGVVAAAVKADVPLLVGHHRRHNPLVAAAKAAIDAGRLGSIRLVNAQFWLYKPDDYFAEAWRRQSGAGPVFINLIHDIDVLRYLCGEIARVEARQSAAARGFDVEDTAAILLEFDNGALGTVSVSDCVVAPWSWEFTSGENPAYPKTDVPSCVIGGSHGSLSIPDMHFWSQPEGRGWWKPIQNEPLCYTPENPLALQLAHFVEVMEGRARPLVSGADGLLTLAVVEAIKRAAETGRGQAPDACHAAAADGSH